MGYSAVAIPDIIREADAHLTASNSSEDTSNTTPLIPSILATSEELSWFGMVHIKIEKKTDKYDLVSIAELEPEPEPPGAAIFCLEPVPKSAPGPRTYGAGARATPKVAAPQHA